MTHLEPPDDATTHRHLTVHPLTDFLTGSVAEVDTADVELHRDQYGTYVAYRDGTTVDDEDVVRIYVDDYPEVALPVTVVGELGAEFTRDEAFDLARALLALVRELDVRANQRHRDEAELRAALRAHRDGSLRRRVVDELAEEL